MEVDEHFMELSESEVGEQMTTLMNEPFVQRVQSFFTMTLEKIKHDPEKKKRFLTLCRTFD